jgi:hypothetical protein
MTSLLSFPPKVLYFRCFLFWPITQPSTQFLKSRY